MRTLTYLAPFLLVTGAAAQVPTEIKIEIDWMATATHSHEPSQDVIDAVVDMFACQGITLTVLLSNEIEEITTMQCPDPGDPEQDFFECTGPFSFKGLKAAYKQSDSSWHYCIFGHYYNAGSGIVSSGLAEIGFDDLVVTLGAFTDYGTEFQRAGTLAHELGHNLGLRHYSPSTPVLGRGPYAPNYASVMSYQYQLRGVKSRMECLGVVGSDHRLKDLDYSHGRMASVHEFFLDEEIGAGAHAVDWDCNGTIDSDDKTFDIDDASDWCTHPGGFAQVYDHDDWASIVDFTDNPELVAGPADYETCMTKKEFDDLLLALDNPSDCTGSPELVNESCQQGSMIFVDPSATGNGGGTGDNPFQNINFALVFSQHDSVFYLQPGTHTSSAGAPLVVDFEAVFAGPGGAVIDP